MEHIREAVETAIGAAIPGAQIHVANEGNHFRIRVISAAFSGKARFARQKMIYGAIGNLMTGNEAPIHAIDLLETWTPEETP